MTKQNHRRAQGFTIIELVVVIVIIGILAATALPRFVDLTGDAQSASVQAIGGALASGVNLSHASWMAQGANASVNSASLEGGITVGLNDAGWPENNLVAGGDGTVTAAECIDVWQAVLYSPPTAAAAAGQDYLVTVASPTCTFTYNGSAGRSIAYNSSTGQVSTTIP